MSNILVIKSAQKDSGTSSNFVITPFDPIDDRWELKLAAIPLSNSHVNSNNNTFLFTDNSIARTGTITPGNYDSPTLPAALKSAMETANSGFQTYTITYSSTTGKLTVTAGANFSITGESSSSAITQLRQQLGLRRLPINLLIYVQLLGLMYCRTHSRLPQNAKVLRGF